MSKSGQQKKPPPTIDEQSLLRAARTLSRRDPHLRRVYQQHGPPPLWHRPATFATFVRIILEQQVSLASARSTFAKLKSACDGRVTAAHVVGLQPEDLRGLGFSRQKARYTLALADDVMCKRFRIGSLRFKHDDEVRQQITARLGLGNWSADIFLLMSLRRPDVLPTGDLALVKAMSWLDGGDYDNEQKVVERSEIWKPLRSVATRMIWQGYLSGALQKPK